MIPKEQDKQEEEYNHTIKLKIFNKEIILSLIVNSKE